MLKLNFVCVMAGEPQPMGQVAKLQMPKPPPEPAADGHGNPIAAPRIPTGFMELFVTTEARRTILRPLDGIKRRLKRIKFELGQSRTSEEGAVLRAEQAKLENDADGILRQVEALKEFRFEHGEQYEVTIAKRGGGK